MKKEINLIGAAGEHLVLSRLLARQVLASKAPFNAYMADILVNPTDKGRPLLIQVKTTSGRGPTKKKTRSGKKPIKKWLLNKKDEPNTAPNLFYCFVDLSGEHPSVYVIPSKLVATRIKTGHQDWLKTPGRKGQKHNDSAMRALEDRDGWMDKYLEKWDLLK